VTTRPRIEAIALGSGVFITHDNLVGIGVPRAVAAHAVAAGVWRTVHHLSGVEEPVIPADTKNVLIKCKSHEHAKEIAAVINAIPSFADYVRAALAVLGCAS
jgi:hypothetical protein